MDDRENIAPHFELEAKLAAIYRSQAVIEFDMGGAVLFANERFLEAFGYTLEEVHGRHHSMFVEIETQRSEEYAAFWQTLRNGEYTTGEYKRIGKGGREVWIQATYNPIFDLDGRPFKVVKYASDVTAAKLMTADYSGQIAAIGRSQAVIEFDLEGHILSANDIFLNMMGCALDDIQGRHHRMFVDPTEVRTPEYEAFWSELRLGQHQSGEFRRHRRDGGEVWLQAYYTPINDMNGRPFKIVKYAADVTETIRRRQSETHLEAARTAAEAMAKSKSDFLATMSHELRTPLTSILGFSGLLRGSDALSETDKTYIDLICGAGEALLQVVNDILDFSKLDAGAMTMSPAPFSPQVLVKEVCVFLGQQAAAKGLEIHCDLDQDIVLLADAARLRQVLLNLIGNAVKFTAEGRIDVLVRTPLIDGDRHLLQIEVQDSGIGIPPSEIDRLFQRFAQVDGATTQRFGGTGLGLAISRQIVECMGGEIGVESDGVTGSTFRLSIALDQAGAGAVFAPAEDQTPAYDRRLRILFADDHAANRLLVAAMLEPFDIDLDQVENGAEAVEAATGAVYDVILMDVQMPIMDGPAAAAALRAHGVATPIIALSANVLPEQIASYLAVGMQGHVAKPINLADLLAEIGRHCGDTQDLRSAA